MTDNQKELYITLRDDEWPMQSIDHDREIVRAIVVDGDSCYYFMRVERDDDFGKETLIETSGGGVEPGEELDAALRRELMEELGAEVEILCKIGVVSDYYNLIRRHNINHYFLCRVKAFGGTHMTEDEREIFHLSRLKLRYHEALEEYRMRSCSKLGKLIANREVPVLQRANELLSGGR